MSESTPPQTPTLPFTIEQGEMLGAIFTPHTARRVAEARRSGLRLSHYTSAANAVDIIRTKTLWLRNATAMADWMEVQYGFENLAAFFGKDDSKNFKRLKEAFAEVAPETPES